MGEGEHMARAGRVGLLEAVQSQTWTLGLHPFICKMDGMLTVPEEDGSGRESVMERIVSRHRGTVR